MSSPKPNLRVQIHQIDHTLSPPGFLDNSSLYRVPIIRIYGPTSLGNKACLHVHQVYPYFYVDYPGNLAPDDVNAFIRKLSHSLNYALAISLKRNPQSPKNRYIRAVLMVKGIHFYGYHSSYSPFLKILMVDPTLVSRAVTIMQSGTIMRTRFCAYESHLSYLLQFMCDFGLYGCGWIDLDEVWQRGTESEYDPGISSTSFKPSLHHRESRLDLEIDVASHQILNRHRLTARSMHHKHDTPTSGSPAVPLVPSVRELWDDERAHRLASGLNPSLEIPADLSANSRASGGNWAAEAHWWDEIRKRIEGEVEVAPDIGAEGGEADWEAGVMTTFESVEALWDPEWRIWKPRTDIGAAKDTEGKYSIASHLSPNHKTGREDVEDGQYEDVEVNETLLTSQEMTRLVELADADWERIVDNNDLAGDDEYPDEEELPDPSQDLDQNSPSVSQGGLDENISPLDGIEVSSHDTRCIEESEVVGFRTPRTESPGSEQMATPTKSRDVTEARNTAYFLEKQPQTMNVRKTLSPAWKSRTIEPVEGEHARPDLPESPTEISTDHAYIVEHSLTQTQVDSRVYKDRIVSSTHRDRNLVDTCPNQDASPVNIELGISPPLANVTGDASEPILVAPIEPTVSPTSQAPVHSLTSISTISPPRIPPSMSLHTTKYVYAITPPTSKELEESIDRYAIPSQLYRDPYYSKESDAPDRSREYSGLVYHLRGEGLAILEEWYVADQVAQGKGFGFPARRLKSSSSGGWEYASCPPSVREVKTWLSSDLSRSKSLRIAKAQSQIEGVTQENIYGLNTPVVPSEAARIKQNMTIFSLELFVPTRGKSVPDPSVDEIAAVFYAFRISNSNLDNGSQLGVIAVKNDHLDPRRVRDICLAMVLNELELINRIVDVILDFDPDVIVGWEVQHASWGYLNARSKSYGLDLPDLISRAPPRASSSEGVDQWGIRKTSTFRVAGRHTLNVWRIMRNEQALRSYTLENVAFHVLRKRLPLYSFSTLTRWFTGGVPAQTAQMLRYFLERTSTILLILEEAEIITKTAEFARVFGVDFYSVISRGSQFKVESVVFRIAKPESFVLISPSKQDVGKQNAAECMPLIMEPLSAFYKGPLLVLDFQSLYPSVMIAYNYCYSTCIGRVTEFKGKYKFGVLPNLPQPPGLLKTLQEYITVAPNGVMYLRPTMRKGLLGRMLTELLDTRVMVKQAMKNVSGNKARKRILDARQLGLKYICNVTYGYTSASFSGRMPAVEIADSIVQIGRETLEKAIHLINGTKKWGAKVVYGDTDSVFVYLPGKTKEQAFRIGNDIADSVTASNPAPIKLRFEKVYLPCILMAKKRYVGYKYDNPNDTEPILDAKGIETVRRDGVPAQHKMVEKCLVILFRTQDLSKVKAYCWESWTKILDNKVSIQDFIFAREVKLGTYSDRVPPQPGVMVAAKRAQQYQSNEPQYGERVPYVVVRGDPNSRLVDRSVDPRELLENHHKHLDGPYYIWRVLIPPLERIFNLLGADVRGWYEEMPKALRADQPDPILLSPRKESSNINRFKIDEHFNSLLCINCGTLAFDRLCEDCRMRPQITISDLMRRVRRLEKRFINAHQVCTSCTASAPCEPIECESLDCPWLYERKKAEFKVESVSTVEECILDITSESESPTESVSDSS